ncbi:hypothetical protein [Dyella silvatica]|uniref:hypothetical protein n=1 Tax=Dyella silvatica TaxID=2992128 RepID=UPI002257FEB1|nr:hypothetical protein [Dyella silvatica]
MGAGLECYDANGALLFDTTYAPGRCVGSVDTNGSSGSINVPEFSMGKPFVVLSVTSSPIPHRDANGNLHAPVKVSISGNTLSWKYAGDMGGNTTIVYGYSP